YVRRPEAVARCRYPQRGEMPRLCENVHEPRTRSIVFSIVFPRWRPSVRSFFRLTEIEKDLLRAICEPRFSHSLAPILPLPKTDWRVSVGRKGAVARPRAAALGYPDHGDRQKAVVRKMGDLRCAFWFLEPGEPPVSSAHNWRTPVRTSFSSREANISRP